MNKVGITTQHFVLALFAVLVFTAFDYVVGQHIDTSIFHLVPIAYVAFYGKRWQTITLVTLSELLYTGIEIIVLMHQSPLFAILWNSLARGILFMIIAIGAQKLGVSYQREAHFSNHDPLTGALNRRALERLLLEHMMLTESWPLTIAYIDIDNFKQVNDRLSHAAGDALLSNTIRLLSFNARKGDRIGRLGGDEFMAIYPGANEAMAKTIVIRQRDAIHDYYQRKAFGTSLSIGVVTFHHSPADMMEMIRQADAAMYQAKNSGKSQIIYSSYFSSPGEREDRSCAST